MIQWLSKYTDWLHTRWPAGIVEKLPEVREDYSTNIPGLYIVGDLTGIPLLKFSADAGARAVQTILADTSFHPQSSLPAASEVFDLVIIGAGVSGMAAALAAEKAGLRFELLEAAAPFTTILNFPKGKPIYTYPTEMVPEGDLQFTATVKETLLEELSAQTLQKGIQPQLARVEKIRRNAGGAHFEVFLSRNEKRLAKRVIIAIGRSGNFRKLGVPGEDLNKVYNRLHDPKEFCGQQVLVVGGGDSAMETAIAIAQCGGHVTLSYRKAELTRPKPDNLANLNQLKADPRANVAVKTPTSERVTTSSGAFLEGHIQSGSIRLMLKSQVQQITEKTVVINNADAEEVSLPNDAVFSMIGREAPLDFFRRSRIKISGEMDFRQWFCFLLFFAFCAFVYHWKSGGVITRWFAEKTWFPFNVTGWLEGMGASAAAAIQDISTIPGILSINLTDPGFYYSTLYTLLIIIFGCRRIRRRKTPYVKIQTLSLTAIQIIPLFLLPYIILPLMGQQGFFDTGIGKTIADALFPIVNYGYGREYWRAFGFILAWPLFIWNVFTDQPMWGWLMISALQTFLVIPLLVYFWGKGAYCGWICSCGAMAETLGDEYRHKMPHGAKWNRVNMLGQVILGIVFLLFLFRVFIWLMPGSAPGELVKTWYYGLLQKWTFLGIPLNYKYIVDLFLAGIVGYGAYFWFSGRVWCRFACPLAALMHIYARFSRFRIFADKKKCISCNVCTSVCHQGIDIMNFANKGLPMADPECVRCSACVQSCPTGVLQFGQINRKTGQIIQYDTLAASPVSMKEAQPAAK